MQKKIIITERQLFSPRIILRYTLLQLPELAVLVLVLMLIRRWINIPAWSFWGLIVCWVVKDIILFPFLWRAYDCDDEHVKNSMIGLQGFAADRLAPSGYIRIRGELLPLKVLSCWFNPSLTIKIQKARSNDPF